MTFNKLNIVTAAIFVLLLPILLVACAAEDADTAPQLTQSQIEEIVRAEVAKTPATPGPSRAEVEQIVSTAVSDIPDDELTRDDVEQVVQSAIEAAMTRMAPADPGLTLADVEQAVQSAIADMPESQPGLTAAEIRAIVQAAIPEPDFTLADVEKLVKQAISEAAEANPPLTQEEVGRLARRAIANIPSKFSPPEYTKFFVENAISRYNQDGLDRTLAHYNNRASVDGQWFVFIIDENGKVIGHYDPNAIGQDLNGPFGADANGYEFGPDILSATEDGKWVSYVSQNPQTGVLGAGDFQLKNVWVVKHDDLLFASGWHIPSDEFTKQLVAVAVHTFRAGGLEDTVNYFASPESALAGLETAIAYYNTATTVDGQWFTFIANQSGRFVAHSKPALIGRGVEELFGTEIFHAPADGTWITNDAVRVWVSSFGGFTFGSGWHHGDLGDSTIVDLLTNNADAFEYAIGEHGGALTFATISEPLTFNLAISTDASSSGVLGYLFEGLTETSWLTDQVEPSLAKSWEHSEDGLTWTFHLRDDVKWHDGEPFTAHDVAFTFNRIIYNPDIPASSRPTFHFRSLNQETGVWEEAPMTVRAIDNHTVECVLPVPFAPFLRSMGTSIYPKHILEPHVEDGSFAATWDINTDPSEIIGTGAFTIGSYVPGEHVIMTRNPDYWLKDAEGNSLPYLDEVVHDIVPNLEDELTKFLDGEADSHGVLGEELPQLVPLQKEGNFTIHRRGPAFGTTFFAFNMNPGSNPDTGESYLSPEKLAWFSNTQFRQAVAHVIDKKRIIDEAQHGAGYPQWSSVSPAAGDFHNPNVTQYEYDIARANEILDNLGWVDTNGDGVREDADGNEIAFTLVTNTGNTVRANASSIIHEGMTAIGLNVDYQLIEFGVMVSQLVSTYDWETLVVGFTGGTEPHYGITMWHSGEGLHLWHPYQSEPATDWEAELDEIYIKASQELDRDARVALYHRAQDIVAENVPLLYTTLSERLSAVRNVFGNATPTLYGLWDTRYLYRTDLDN